MPQALITVNTVVGSNVVLPINTLVALDNINVGGETSYTWSILDQPPGTVDVLSSVSVQNPTFTPKKEGTYLIRLIVNQGAVTEQENRVVCGIRQLKTLERIPAAGETTEGDLSDGWATPSNSLLRRIDTLLSDPGIMVGVNTGGVGLARGQVVRAPATAVIKSTLPGQETVPGFSLAHANVLGEIDELLCVVEGQPDGTTTIPGAGTTEARLMKVRYIGRLSAVAIANGPIAAGAIVYLNDAGALDRLQGTLRRRVGTAMDSAANPLPASTSDVWFDGVGGSDVDLTPITEKYVTWGASVLPNAQRIDGVNATGVLASSNRFKAGDVLAGTVALEAQAFAGSTEDIFRVMDPAAVSLVRVDSTGRLIVSTSGMTVTAGGVLISAGGLAVTAGGFALGAGDIALASATTKISWPTWFIDQSATMMRFYSTGTRGAALTDIFGVLQVALTDAVNSVYLQQVGAVGILGTFTAGDLRFQTTNTTRWQITAAGILQGVGGDKPIQNVLDPVLAQDAATKNYVDAHLDFNAVHNGAMDFWQRETQAKTITTLAAAGYTGRYMHADRWSVQTRNDGAAINSSTFTRQTAGVQTPNSQFNYRIKNDTAAGATRLITICQEIDKNMVRRLRNRFVTVTLKLRKGTTFVGTPTILLTSNVGGLNAGFAGLSSAVVPYAGVVLDNISVNPSITTSFATYTATSTQLPPAMDDLAVSVGFTVSGASAIGDANDFIEVAEVMLTEGSGTGAGAFKYAGGDLNTDFYECLRHFEKSYYQPTPVFPATGTLTGATIRTCFANTVVGGSAWNLSGEVRYEVEKWSQLNSVLATFIRSSVTGLDGKATFFDTSASTADRDSIAINDTPKSFALANNGANVDPGNCQRVSFHWWADAEVK